MEQDVLGMGNFIFLPGTRITSQMTYCVLNNVKYVSHNIRLLTETCTSTGLLSVRTIDSSNCSNEMTEDD